MSCVGSHDCKSRDHGITQIVLFTCYNYIFLNLFSILKINPKKDFIIIIIIMIIRRIISIISIIMIILLIFINI